ncbi:hypothetical protein J2X31_003702 [Flavobacterium arsenatis]|uniref:Uncharacterized protein n=1 Tax=Flavobacterium arsenatis TaxID=1484332 RepID=A0ABU1TUU9_9FLAO|nr:hypothetical protein [Flavobacterium arsenatis]MDR6969668.1 hypothetical protein [Flavobacterium arsenatis]
MKHLIELNENINKFSNQELLNNFNKTPSPYGEYGYYPVFASRILEFKKLLFEELIADRNVKIEFRTFKPSWLIAISVLDHCEDENIIKEMIKHIKNNWRKDDFDDFKHYVSKEDRFKKYF